MWFITLSQQENVQLIGLGLDYGALHRTFSNHNSFWIQNSWVGKVGLLEKHADLFSFLLKVIGIFPTRWVIPTWVITSVSEWESDNYLNPDLSLVTINICTIFRITVLVCYKFIKIVVQIHVVGFGLQKIRSHDARPRATSVNIMTSSNWNIFRVTVPLYREFTGHRWVPPTKAIGVELWCFLWFAPE